MLFRFFILFHEDCECWILHFSEMLRFLLHNFEITGSQIPQRCGFMQLAELNFSIWSKILFLNFTGDLIHKANHIALTVSDIGRSLGFYTDILGLQQIKRPNFDRHGAWLTMGNIELHLILGQPVVPSGKDLIVSHISLESNNIEQVMD